MFEQIEAIIFDMDGTLIDSMWMWHEIDSEFLARFGCEKPANLHMEIEGMGFPEASVYFKEHFPIPHTPEEIQQMWHEMAEYKYLHEVSLKKGVAEFLARMSAKGIRMGIATSNSRKITGGVLKALGIGRYFQTVVTADEVEHSKPSPDIYLKAAAGLGISPEHCLVFEDIPAGIIAGKRAGMRVCAVEDDFSAHQLAYKQELADYFIHSFTELKGKELAE